MPIKWPYYLLDAQGRSYRKRNKVIEATAQKTRLPESPEGWQDISIAWERDWQKIGVMRNFSVTLGFVGDGADILKKIVYTENVEKKVFLLIQKLKFLLTDTYFRWVYQYFYKGELDLSTFKDNGRKVTCNISEGGVSRQLKANESTTYEFAMDDPEAITVKMDGLNLYKTDNFVIVEGESLYNIVPITYTRSDGSAPYVAAISQDVGDSKAYFLANIGTESVVIREVSGSVVFQPNSFTEEVNIILYKLKNGVFTELHKVHFDHPSSNSIHTANFNLPNIQLLPDETLALRGDVFGGINAKITYKETSFKASYYTRYRTTYVKAFLPNTVYKKLTGKITGSELNCSSSMIEQNNTYALSPGDAVRGLKEAKLKTTIKDFSQFCRVVMAGGIGVEKEKIVIEGYDHYFPKKAPIYLGKIKKLENSTASDQLYNKLKIGYESQKIDDVNGKHDFHCTHQYNAPLTVTDKELPLICPYIASAYYNEITRAKLGGQDTTDNSADNEIFIMDVEEKQEVMQVTNVSFVHTEYTVPVFNIKVILNTLSFSTPADPELVEDFKISIAGAVNNAGTFTVQSYTWNGGTASVTLKETVENENVASGSMTYSYYILHRPVFDSISGLPSPETIFNIRLSPKRLLLKHSPFINSLFSGFAGQKLTFQTTEKNDTVKTVKGSEVIEEKGHYTITSSNRLFHTLYHDFETEVPVNLPELLEEDPNHPFSFTDEDGDTFTGALCKVGIAPNDNKEQAYKLISSPDNDLSKFL